MEQGDVDTARQLLADAGSGFIADTAVRHLGFSIVGLLIVVGFLAWLVKRGEKSVGFDLKKAVDNMEEAGAKYVASGGASGTIWPIPVLLVVVIVCATWIAVTVIRP